MTAEATPTAERLRLESVLAQLPDPVLRRRLSELRSFDAREASRRTTCPLLALRASRDRLAPHWLLRTEPEACVAAMDAFLAAAIVAPPRSS